MLLERVARLVEGHVLGQRHRQVRLRHRHVAAGLAVDDGNRAAPVALARHAPVPQTPGDGAPAAALALGALGDRRLGALDVEAVEALGVDERSVAGIGLVADGEGGRILARRQHHRNHR